MAGNAFADLYYGAAPPPVEPAAAPPPVYEETAPPPVQEAPAPVPQSSGNTFADVYNGSAPAPAPAPQAPPQNFVPGSTYRPPSAAPLPAPAAPQEAPPPDLEPWKVKDPTPQSLEGMNPVERALRERAPAALQGAIPDITGFQNAPGVMDKAGHLIGGLNVFSDYGTDRTVKRAVDAATVGDPNATMGGISPGDIIQNPSNILDILPTLGANVPGGENELNDWLTAHPDVVAEYERTGDSQAVMDAWLKDTRRTLETGGIPGAVAGAIRTGAQDVSILPTAGVGSVARTGANAARLAGQEGLARGITVTDDIIQGGIDPAGMALGKAVGGIFGLGREAENVARSDVTREVVGANLIERRATGTGAMTPNANLAPAPVPPPVGPVAPTPAPMTPGLPMGPIAAPPGTLLPPAQGAPNMTPNAANLPGQRVISSQGPIPPVRTPNALTVPQSRPQPPSPNGSGGFAFPNGTTRSAPISPNGTRAVAPIMRDPARPPGNRWVKATGDPLDERDLQLALRDLETVDPDDLVAFPEGSGVVPNERQRPAMYLAAMTEKKYALDDWHSGRTGDKGKMAAGKRWIDLTAKRIANPAFREREVSRLLSDFKVELQRDLSSGAQVPAHRRTASYWDDRARSIIEAANKAGYDESFTITTPKATHTYLGKDAAAPKATADRAAPQWTGNVMEDGVEAIHQTSVHFPSEPERRDVVNRLMDMLENPAAFGDDPAAKRVRQRMYRSGAWSQTKASPVKAGDSVEVVAKKAAKNAAYERYQAFRAWHEAQHGASVSPGPYIPPVARDASRATDVREPLTPRSGHAYTAEGLPDWVTTRKMAADIDVGDVRAIPREPTGERILAPGGVYSRVKGTFYGRSVSLEEADTTIWEIVNKDTREILATYQGRGKAREFVENITRANKLTRDEARKLGYQADIDSSGGLTVKNPETGEVFLHRSIVFGEGKFGPNTPLKIDQSVNRSAEYRGGGVGASDAMLQAGKALPLISGPGRRVDNGFSLETMGGEVDAGLAKSLQDGFRAHLDKMGLGHVRLTFDDYLVDEVAPGQFQQTPAFGVFSGGSDDMELAISYTMDEVVREARQSFGDDGLRILAETGELDNSVRRALYQTLNHEGLHAFRASGVIKDSEWKALVNEARKRGYHDWALDTYGPDPATGRSVYQYDNTFDALTRGNDQFDEEAVAEMFGDFALNKAALSPATRNVFQRMVDLVKGLIDVVVRSDGQRVMEDLLSGKIGSRAPNVAPVNPWSGNTRYLQKGKRFSSTKLGAMDLTPDEIDPAKLGRHLTAPQWAVLQSPMPWKGADKTLFEVSNEIADDADYLRFLAQRNQTHGLSGPMQQDFDRLTKQFDLEKRIPGYEQRFDWSDPKMTDDEVDRVATALFMDEWQKAKLPNMTPKQKTAMFGAIMQLNSDINGLRRSVGLANPIGAVRQIMVQTFGNVAMFGVAKPKAITGMFKPGEYVKAFRAQQSDAVLSPTRQFLKDFGFPDNAQLDLGTKTLAKNATGIQNPLLKGAANILAPKWSRNLVATPDDVARNAIFRSAMIPGMKREQAKLPAHGVEMWKAYDAKWKGQMPPIAPQEIEQTISRTLKAAKKRGDPFSRATGADIEKAILAAFGGKAAPGTPQAKHLRDFANRVGRDWNSARNTNLQLATKEVQRVAFTWDQTKLDDFVSHFALYHYWASRATGLYAKEFAKNPWKLAALAGFAEELQQDAERNNYPEWLKGMTRLTNSPAGLVLLASPLDLFGAMGIMEDWQFQNRDPLADDGRDNGWFGQMQGIVPLFFGPVPQMFAYVTGGMGGEARPPGITGFEGSFKKAADIVNAANLNGHLPAGMLRDENDMPILVDSNMIGNAVQGMSNRLFGTPMVDLDAGFKANQIFNLQMLLREDHPEWQTDPNGENELTRMVNDMKAQADMGEYTEEWQESERLTLEGQFAAPESIPEPFRGLFRLASPVRITALPEERAMDMYGFGNKERETQPNPENPNQQVAVRDPLGTRDTYDAKDKKGSPYDTLDMALLSAANEDYMDFGKDSGIADAAQMSNAIGKGEIATTFKIGDFTYTPEQLSLMSKGEKWELAEKYLNSKGFTQADKDQYYADKEAIRAAHPDLQGYLAYRDYVNGYAGGVQTFVDTAVRTSPSFARFMADLPYAPGTEDYYKAALWSDAYYAIDGRRGSIYDPTTLPDRGTVPGMALGTTFAQNAALQEAAEAAAASSEGGSGTGNSFESFVADVDKKVTNYYHAQRLLDETYPGSGLRAGVDRLEYGAYKNMLAIWDANGVDAPDKNDIAIEYYDWLGANATASDHSVKAFLNDRERTGGSAADLAAPTAEQIAAQRGLTLVESTPPKLTGSGQIDTSGMQRVSPAMPVEMRTGPSLSNPVNIQSVHPGMILHVADIEGDWAEVIGPGGAVGWVPTAALKKAA